MSGDGLKGPSRIVKWVRSDPGARSPTGSSADPGSKRPEAPPSSRPEPQPARPAAKPAVRGLRQTVTTGTPREAAVGSSHAVRVGASVHVSGTTATDPQGDLVGRGDPYMQALQALRNIEVALQAVGARLEHVVRTRIYVTNIEAWEKVGKAHREVFGANRPATILIEVSRLIDPDTLVEIEADAIIGN